MPYSVEDVTKPIPRQHNAYKFFTNQYNDAYCGSGTGVAQMSMVDDD